MAEAVSTFGARVRLLACVYAQVGFERPGLAKATATDSTRVGLLPCVDADVLLQARDQAEGLPALQAVVRSICRGLPYCIGG